MLSSPELTTEVCSSLILRHGRTSRLEGGVAGDVGTLTTHPLSVTPTGVEVVGAGGLVVGGEPSSRWGWRIASRSVEVKKSIGPWLTF